MASMDGKYRPQSGFDARTVQQVASRYTDWATPAQRWLQEATNRKSVNSKSGSRIPPPPHTTATTDALLVSSVRLNTSESVLETSPAELANKTLRTHWSFNYIHVKLSRKFGFHLTEYTPCHNLKDKPINYKVRNRRCVRFMTTYRQTDRQTVIILRCAIPVVCLNYKVA